MCVCVVWCSCTHECVLYVCINVYVYVSSIPTSAPCVCALLCINVYIRKCARVCPMCCVCVFVSDVVYLRLL